MSDKFPRLLIVDDDKAYLASLERALRRDFDIQSASDPAGATKPLGKEPEIILLDMRLDESDVHDKSGVELLPKLLETYPGAPVIMTSAYGDVETAVECMRLGAADFVQKPAGVTELRQRLKLALERLKLSRNLAQLEERIQRLEPNELVGESPQMRQVKQLINMVAQDGYVTVLIAGETGTGKELVARSIHRLGRRAREPFIPVAIASLNANLVESELFGHEAGAFTGARNRRIGFIERARRGVLFLDEMGDLPPEAQLKLLRFLEERRLARVGSSDEVEVDVQVVAATNRNLEEAVDKGQIRKDLYFRLQSVKIFLPPLRERLPDIPLLVDHFLRLFREQGRTRIAGVSKEVTEILTRYHWPGNVRELRGVIERAVIYANYNGRQRVEREDIALQVVGTSDAGVNMAGGNRLSEAGIDLEEELAKVELSYIEQALQLTEERKAEAWKFLGLNDRFALLRRVRILLRRHPSLGQEFPTVQRLYGKKVGT